MFIRYASIVLVIALVGTFGGNAIGASASSDPDVVPPTLALQLDPVTRADNRAKPNAELRTKVLDLIAEARAGKLAPASHAQTQPAKNNNLSKRTKIAIGVGVAVAVVLVILIANRPRVTGPTFQ